MPNQVKPFFFQSAAHDCVPACVLALCHHYRVPLHIRQLRAVLVTDPESGTVIKNLHHLNPWFQVQLGRIDNLPELPTYTPLIAYLVHHHAVMIWDYTADGKRLLVGDHAAGLVEMRMDELLRVWDGVCVVLRPLAEAVHDHIPQETPSIWKRFLHLDSPLRTLQINWWSWLGRVWL